jgi:hypothetical protein
MGNLSVCLDKSKIFKKTMSPIEIFASPKTQPLTPPYLAASNFQSGRTQ